MKASYLNEAKQHGNHKAYCREKSIPYSIFKDCKCEYQASREKENWSPKSKYRLSYRTFTESTEKAAIDKWREAYYDKHQPSTGADLSSIFLSIHNTKYPERTALNVSSSTLMRIKQ